MVNQHSEITFIFSKKIKHSAESKQGTISTQVNETKLTLRNSFILDLFASGGEEE